MNSVPTAEATQPIGSRLPRRISARRGCANSAALYSIEFRICGSRPVRPLGTARRLNRMAATGALGHSVEMGEHVFSFMNPAD